MADTSQFTQQFELPQEAPNGKALFAWGWFNQLGNREMYHVSDLLIALAPASSSENVHRTNQHGVAD